MDDKKLVCKADYEAAKARGTLNTISLVHAVQWGKSFSSLYMYAAMDVSIFHYLAHSTAFQDGVGMFLLCRARLLIIKELTDILPSQ